MNRLARPRIARHHVTIGEEATAWRPGRRGRVPLGPSPSWLLPSHPLGTYRPDAASPGLLVGKGPPAVPAAAKLPAVPLHSGLRVLGDLDQDGSPLRVATDRVKLIARLNADEGLAGPTALGRPVDLVELEGSLPLDGVPAAGDEGDLVGFDDPGGWSGLLSLLGGNFDLELVDGVPGTGERELALVPSGSQGAGEALDAGGTIGDLGQQVADVSDLVVGRHAGRTGLADPGRDACLSLNSEAPLVGLGVLGSRLLAEMGGARRELVALLDVAGARMVALALAALDLAVVHRDHHVSQRSS